MFLPLKNRIAVYKYLFKEGVVVCPKSVTFFHHVIGVPNLQVIKLMLSLKSRGYVRENFNWHHHYFYLTDAGIEYLRNYLHLPTDIIPATLFKPLPAARSGRPEEGGAEGGKESSGGGRRREEGYRREARPV